MPMSERRVEYLPLDDVLAAADPQNPKDHDVDLIDRSVGRFGVIDVITRDDRTGRLISGHGRATTLGTQRDRGADPPDGVLVLEDGTWTVPVNVGWASKNDDEARAALIVLNRATEAGGWIDDALLSALDSLAGTEISLSDVGFNEDDLEALRALVNEEPLPVGPTYTRRADPVQYRPTMEEPPPVAELVNRSKADELMMQIDDVADLPQEVRDFLVAGAQRHLVFDYSKVAEFYAHADPQVQRLMEASALVIIDFEDAVSNGYVRLTERLRELLDLDLDYRATLDQRSDSLRGSLPEPTAHA